MCLEAFVGLWMCLVLGDEAELTSNAELVIAEISTSTIGEYICEARSRYEAIQTPTHVFMFGKFY